MLRIYLCDLVHNYIGAYTYMFPLNVGYISAYARKQFNNDVEIKIFKFPNELITALSEEKPDIVGFSSYMWNANLNMEMMNYIKDNDENIVTVAGGPHIKYDAVGLEQFFKKNKCDYFIPYQGERPFNLIVEMLLEDKKAKLKPLNGCYYYDGNTITKGESLNRIEILDSIPSPYLNGDLDKFFDTNLIPIIETNRGCPYRCTFCAQGLTSFNQVNYFSLKRVYEELEYISKKVKNTILLHFADANFGIVDRDIEIAQKVKGLREKCGYPEKVSSNMAKNRPPEKMIKIADLLGNTAMVISLQSLDNKVLKNVKRENIKNKYFKKIITEVNDNDGVSGTEIILGLPGETFQSHIDTLRSLFEMDVSYIIGYNALILDGTEMDEERIEKKFKFKTKYRLIDSSFGEYDYPLKYAHNIHGVYNKSIKAFEYEEGIRETDTLSEDQILFFRPVHWLIQFMWNYRFYYNFLKCLQRQKVNPLDFILHLVNNFHTNADDNLKELFQTFKLESRKEWFDSPEQLIEFYSSKNELDALKHGSFGKMNGKYIFLVTSEYKREFENFLKQSILNYSGLKNVEYILDALKFDSTKILDLKKIFEQNELSDKLTLKLNYIHPDKKIEKSKEKHNYTFTISKTKYNKIRKLMAQYRHTNLNVTLRKMSEYMPIKELFYDVNYDIPKTSYIELQEDRTGYAQ